MLVAAVMGMPPAQRLEPTAGFFQLGMDSMMSVLLQRALVETLSEPLPTTIVFDYPSVEALTNYLATTLPELAEATDLAGAGQVSLPGKG
ncbi:MAG: acyl carrier protein [Actinobacteria bacterium]|nr:acyl carrier protein [Actinomycetota bacterium]